MKYIFCVSEVIFVKEVIVMCVEYCGKFGCGGRFYVCLVGLERLEDGDCDEVLVVFKLMFFVGVGFVGDDIFGGNNVGGCLVYERDEVVSDVFRGRVDIEKSGYFWFVWRFGYCYGGWWCMYGCSILEGIVGW